MQALLDADIHTVNWFGSAGIDDISSHSGKLPMDNALEILNAHLHEHPLLPMVEKTRTAGVSHAMKWSDVVTLRRFRQTALYHDFFRRLGSTGQLALTLPVGYGSIVGLTFNRSGKDFRPEEVRHLSLLGSHVARAVCEIQGRAEMNNALALRNIAIKNEAVCVVSDEPSLVYATDRARRFLSDYFPTSSDGHLPAELRNWLLQNPKPGDTFGRRKSHARLICACGPAHTISGKERDGIANGSGIRTSVRCLRFSEQSDIAAGRALQRMNLTPRESEILLWVAQGKRDAEISAILGGSVRTVQKHMQRILEKLGVETRTAAALCAMETLQTI
jgi:DNA-binding CsgD family transcriptional regulator